MRDERFFLVAQLWAGLLANPTRTNVTGGAVPPPGIMRIQAIRQVRELADEILRDLNADKQPSPPDEQTDTPAAPKRIRFDDEDDEPGVDKGEMVPV